MLSSVTLLAFAIAAQAAAALSPRTSGSFSVPAVHQASYVRNGTASLLKAYAKYGIQPTREVPAAFLDALNKRQDSSAAATSAGGVEYLVPVNVGGQTLNLDFDTGSSDLWVFSSSLPADEQTGHNIYTPSSTFQNLDGYTWDISYADGSGASGTVGTETVEVGGTTVTSQAVELATQVSSTFVSGQGDGLLGLAFDSINTVQPTAQQTFLGNAASSLDSALIAAFLPVSSTGSYDIGATVSSRYTGSITYTNVDNSNGFWEYPSTSFKVGSKTHSSSGFTGISDTGTTLVLMSDSAVETYYKAVSGATYNSNVGGYVFSCSADLPSLSVSIGGNFATIPGSLLNFGASGDGDTCFGSLQSVGGGTQNIYGDVFFNAFYGVFDLSGPSFGFAPLSD